jgi:hypothetical protein
LYIGNTVVWFYVPSLNEKKRVSASFTYTDLGENIDKISFNLGGNSLIISNMMITDEAETDTNYEPYFEGLRDAKVTEIKIHGKNLFNKDADWYPYSIGEDVIKEHASYRTWFIDVSGLDDVCISLNNPDTEGDVMVIALRDNKLGTVIDRRYTTLCKGQSHTISLQGCDYVAVSVWFTWVDEILPYIQVEAGSVATEYKPFRDPISYPIPAEIQAIEGYGKDGFNIDLVAQESYYNGDKKPLPVPFDSIIKVEGGGSLEFVNEYKNPVPSSVTYLLKEGSI